VTPLTVELGLDETEQVTYVISAIRTQLPTTDTFGVRGEICVTNGGDVPTFDLEIVDWVQTKNGLGPFQDYRFKVLDLSAKPQLDPGERHCYPYEVTFPPGGSGTLYRNQARVTI
jgi:hypothetical protein